MHATIDGCSSCRDIRQAAAKHQAGHAALGWGMTAPSEMSLLLQCCSSLLLPQPIQAFACPLWSSRRQLGLLFLHRTGPAALPVRAPPLPFCPCCLRVAPLPLQAYYGLSLAMNDLAGSVYLNQFLGFVVEFPAYLLVILVIDRLGRRFAISWSMLIGEGLWPCAGWVAWLATCPHQ